MAMIAIVAAMTATAMAAKIGQGMQEKGAADAQAEQDKQNAQLERQAGGAQVAAQDYEAQQQLARISANAGAAGVTMAGSPQEVYTRSAEEAKINDMYTMYSARLAAKRDLYAADVAKHAGKSAEIGSYLGAGGSLLQGLFQVGQMKGWGGGQSAGSNQTNTLGTVS